MSRPGLSPPLRLAPLGSALAALAAAVLLLAALLPGVQERSARRQLLELLQVAAPLLSDRPAPAAQPEALRDWLHRLGQGSEIELSVIPLLSRGTTLPETQEALATGQGTAARRHPLTGRDEVHAALLVTDRGGGRRWLLHATQPLPRGGELPRLLLLSLLLAGVVAVLGLVPWSFWLERHLLLPLARLSAGSGELALGRYSHRLEVPETEELVPVTLALNRLAAAVEGQLAALRHERDHLRSILTGMSEGVLVVGRDGRAVFANAAFCRLFELSGEVPLRPVLEIVRQPELARLVDSTLASGLPQSAAIELQGLHDVLDRPRRSLELASAALLEEGGGAVVVVRDTTELNRLTEMRRDFVANVSHEIKTPLAVIRGFAETLRDGALEEPAIASRFIERILSQCHRLQELLDDLLVLSRLESLDQPLRREPVALAALLQRAVDLLEPAAEEKEIAIEIEEAPVPDLCGDPNGLERMLTNLLANAIKYNRPGGEVLLRLSSTVNQVVIEVSDTGIGIPVEARGRIFERFYRVDKGRAREEGGTGLGLAIVKHVVQSHGGQIEVEGRPGGGTTFRVTLPVAAER